MKSEEEDTSNPELPTEAAQEVDESLVFNESVAHQIIRQFIDELGKEDAYVTIAKKLEAVIFEEKPTEADIKTALFGEMGL